MSDCRALFPAAACGEQLQLCVSWTQRQPEVSASRMHDRTSAPRQQLHHETGHFSVVNTTLKSVLYQKATEHKHHSSW